MNDISPGSRVMVLTNEHTNKQTDSIKNTAH